MISVFLHWRNISPAISEMTPWTHTRPAARQVDGQSVTLEPGGQFELSGAPLDDLGQTDAETRSHLDQVQDYACSRALRHSFVVC